MSKIGETSSTASEAPSKTSEAIDPSWTVNETIRRRPATVSVFRRFGIDSCCGGDLPLEEAARRHGISIETLLDELRREGADG